MLHFLRHLGKRVYRDDITALAGHLAYVSLLSLVPLVPLVTVIFALFAAFPVFSDVSIERRHFIFTNFMRVMLISGVWGFGDGGVSC